MAGTSSFFIVTFKEYSEITRQGRERLFRFADDRGVACEELIVTRDPRTLFGKLHDTFALPQWRGRSVLVDISTMPRQVIWWICSALKSAQCELEYVYHRPETYPDD